MKSESGGGGVMLRGGSPLGIVVEGSVPIPAGFSFVGEIVSAKVGVTLESQHALPVRRHVLAVRGHLLVALTYSAEEKPHPLTYLRLKLPFVNYIQDYLPSFDSARVIYSVVECQHASALYYCAALLLSPGESHEE